MLRIVTSRSSEQALSYYGEALAREDYYAQGAESAGLWGGDGARRLGLTGGVDRDSFERLVQNRDPITGDQLTPRRNAERRVGYDFNFHCPKSVSVVHALSGDEGILQAFQESVHDTMLQLEGDMQARVRRSGEMDDRTTGNMVWAEFVHRTARPVEGVSDPHLHAHCFVFNATYDSEEARWKAGQFGNIKRDAPYYEACFHARFASRVRELGYEIERNGKGWEIAGISRETIEKFSQRTEQVKKAAKELGLTDKAMIDRLGATTREAKRRDVTMEELKEEWKERLSDRERESIRVIEGNKAKEVPREHSISLDECIDHAERHHFERASVVSERRLLAEAIWRGVGSIDLHELHEREQQRDYLRAEHDGQRIVTTKSILAEEKAMIESVKLWRGTCRALKAEPHEFIQQGLSEEQRNAVRHVLESQDRVTGIRGGAGTGKTSLMREAVTAMRGSGQQVYLFAPSSEASRSVLRGEGFEEADTVARLLIDPELQEKIRGQVVWVDEAGLLGTRSMKKVIDLVREKDARLILSGDTRQHHSVERGDSLRLLQEQAGLSCAELKTIYRQTGEYKEAITAISEGSIEAGLAKLDALGGIRELESHRRFEELAEDYAAAVEAKESVLVVSPTHKEAAQATEAIREQLRRMGRLGPQQEERIIPSFKSLGLTEAQRSDPANYRAGLYVEFQTNAKGFQIGQRWQVAEVGEDYVGIEHREGTRANLPLDQASRYEVFRGEDLPIAVGDQIQFRKNGKSLESKNRIHNGSFNTIAGFDDAGNIILDNDMKIAPDFGHVGYGYVVTSHASQGKTVKHVLIAQGSDSWGASSREQLYVSASRGRESVRIYTDSREELLEAVLGSSMRLSASELDFQRPLDRMEYRAAAKREHDRIAAPPEETGRQTEPAQPVLPEVRAGRPPGKPDRHAEPPPVGELGPETPPPVTSPPVPSSPAEGTGARMGAEAPQSLVRREEAPGMGLPPSEDAGRERRPGRPFQYTVPRDLASDVIVHDRRSETPREAPEDPEALRVAETTPGYEPQPSSPTKPSPSTPQSPTTIGPTFSPKVPSLTEFIRWQELLAKYGGTDVASPTEPQHRVGHREWDRLLDEYGGGTTESDEEARKRRERDRQRDRGE
jgi:conjugative relaxase-like TrwC/TraI family protein